MSAKKSIRCNETNQIYSCAAELAQEYSVSVAAIKKALKNNGKFRGKSYSYSDTITDYNSTITENDNHTITTITDTITNDNQTVTNVTGDVVTLSRDEYEQLLSRATGWENACRTQAEKNKQLEEEYKKIIEKQTREIIALQNKQQDDLNSKPDEELEDYSWAQFE